MPPEALEDLYYTPSRTFDIYRLILSYSFTNLT